MDIRKNRYIMEMVKDITVARMSNATLPICKEGGEDVADFMQEIFNKFVELHDSEI